MAFFVLCSCSNTVLQELMLEMQALRRVANYHASWLCSHPCRSAQPIILPHLLTCLPRPSLFPASPRMHTKMQSNL